MSLRMSRVLAMATRMSPGPMRILPDGSMRTKSSLASAFARR